MKSLRTIFQILAGALAAAASPAHAQQEETHALQFITFPMTLEPLRVEMLVGEGKTIQIEVPSNELGQTVRVPIMPSLVFGETVLDAEQKPRFKIYGQCKPASSPEQLVLLLRKGTAMSDGVEVRAIPGDIKGFAAGKFLFVNATRTDIAGKSGKERFALKPGSHTIMKPGLEANGRLTHVEFFYSDAGKPVPFFSSMWPVSKNWRSLVFFYNDPNNGNKVNLHSFRHFLEE